MLDTIALNDGEEIKDLNHKIHILTEENNILIKHLNEMKVFIVFSICFMHPKIDLSYLLMFKLISMFYLFISFIFFFFDIMRCTLFIFKYE